MKKSGSIIEMIRLVRPGHWIKNVVVLLPVLFGMRMGDTRSWINAFAAAVAFCLISSFGYILNDIMDRKADSGHPSKRNRPIASGSITVLKGGVLGVILLLAGVAVSWRISPLLLGVACCYLLLQVCYSLALKHVVLIDVICIAIGFVLRAVAGALAIRVSVSPWLVICMFTLCLFMGFCKRFSEVVTIGDMTAAKNHRPTLISYTSELLTHLITLTAGIAIISFLLYGLSDSTIANFGTNYFVYTLPVVIYAIFRFAMLSMEGAYSDPTDLILHDIPFQATIVLWMGLVFVVIKYGSGIESRLQSF